MEVTKQDDLCQNKQQEWQHHLLPLALVEGAKEAGNEHVELPDLLLVVVLQRVLVALLQPREGCAHLMLVLKTELRVKLFYDYVTAMILSTSS